MSVYRIFSWVGLFTLGGVLTFVCSTWLRTPGQPVLACPSDIDLGERQPGEVAVAAFPLSNTGGVPLVIEDVRTSCSCAGLEIARDGTVYRVDRLVLAPGERAEASFRVAVAAKPGTPQRVYLSFRTNDPVRPAVQLLAVVPRVVGRPSASPEELHFGTVTLNRSTTELLSIAKNGLTGLRMVGVKSSHPNEFGVSMEAASPGYPEEYLSTVVRVTLNTGRPNKIVGGSVLVDLADDAGAIFPVVVAVGGRVRQLVEAQPPVILLGGRTLSGMTHLAGVDGQPFVAKLLSAPDDLSTQIEPQIPQDGQHQSVLTVHRADPGAAGGVVRVAVTPAAGDPFILEVPVRCASH